MLRARDDWERLVGAVIKKQQLWELFHANSISSSETSLSSDLGSSSFSLEKWSGPEKRCMLSARDLSIVWGDTDRYWQWIHLPNSRFDEVAELLNVCWFEIRGKINTRVLSPNTNYAALLVFALKSRSYGLEKPVETAVTINGQGRKRSVCLDPEGARRQMYQTMPRRNGLFSHLFIRQQEINNQQPACKYHKQREDGWFEVELGEFFIKEGAEEDGELEISLMEVKTLWWKSGLIIEGIEIRPKIQLLGEDEEGTADVDVVLPGDKAHADGDMNADDVFF